MGVWIMPEGATEPPVIFDVIESETYLSALEISSHPVERGSDVTDHVRLAPNSFSIVGIVSNTPIHVNPFTGRGEQKTFKLTVPQYDVPLEPTPGSLARNAAEAIRALWGPLEYSVAVLAFPTFFDAIREMYEALRAWQKNGTLLYVVAPIREYGNLLIESLSVTRVPGEMCMARYTVGFQQIRLVESATAAVVPPVPEEPRGVPAKAKGEQKPEQTPEQQRESLLHAAKTFVGL